ncbi:snare associated Golgi protein-domain-containing protein [Gilbertella persicaria]|uniref:snare associated Golgi protein-domain-containing protein n=1 Tax=Gilbertella persicaria TaxID=101096 RepID=UPI00221EB51A|nr:snare associated Golgi protein-domain-containing protein [Gilbertella persicaria]KAI8062346.1 snare associated Golgi protein-domain-containing protein [Gilbertella persicaria]
MTPIEHSDLVRQDDSDIELPNLSLQQQEPLLDQTAIETRSRWQRLKQKFTIQNIKTFLYEKRWSIGTLAFFTVLGIITYHYRREFFEALELLSHRISDMGYKGHILMASLIFLSSFPPIMGYGTYQTLSGFTYGFQTGFLISYLSALAGATACFQLSRIWLGHDRIKRMLDKTNSIKMIVKAVEKKGFKLFVLIRFSPYPFNLMNVLFATTHITLTQFVVGTALSLTKIALHVYIGANLTSFAKHLLGEDKDMTEGEIQAEQIKFYGAIALSMLGFLVLIYIYRVAKAVTPVEEEQEELTQEEEMPFLRDEEEHIDNVSLDNWDTWGDYSDQESTSSLKGLGKND